MLALISAGSLVGLLVYVAILAIVIWAIIAIVRWSGVTIPQPVYIILVAFLGIALVLLIARAFGVLV